MPPVNRKIGTTSAKSLQTCLPAKIAWAPWTKTSYSKAGEAVSRKLDSDAEAYRCNVKDIAIVAWNNTYDRLCQNILEMVIPSEARRI